MAEKYELIISTRKDIDKKLKYQLYKDNVLIAKGIADIQNIYDLYFKRYIPKVTFREL